MTGVSGNLEILDFDAGGAAFPKWLYLVLEQGQEKLLDRLVLVSTPRGGCHAFYRCPDGVQRKQKLAGQAGEDGKAVVLIETRGEGGYVLLPGSPEACHPSNKPYVLDQGNLTRIPNISAAERELLLQCARALNEHVEPARLITGPSTRNGNRPGDAFNRKATWEEVLEPLGWAKVGHNGEATYWRRPGKDAGVSATTNFGGSDLLYVFSTNADPFEAGRAYNKFAAHTYLNHSRNFSAAAAALVSKGFGDPLNTIYGVKDHGLIWNKSTNDGVKPVVLTNFTACIARDVVEDDGEETRQSFEIEAVLRGKPCRFTIPANQFSGMQWVVENLGAGAIVSAGYGAKDRAREAIQHLSGDVPTQHVYTHIGWRKIDGNFLYLHAGGSIGSIGSISQVDTRLEGSLKEYDLPDPPKEKQQIADAVRV